MKPSITLILLFVIASFTYSCKKDNNPAANEPQLERVKTTFTNVTWSRTHVINDLSKKITSLTDSANGVLITTLNFEYDANGKMSKVNFVQQGAVTGYYGFEYNSGGTIRKRQVGSGTINAGDDYNTYSYDASGHLIADSLYSKGSGSTYQLFSVSKFYYTDGNVTKAEYYTPAGGVLQLQSSRKYEYDNKPNRYKKLENYYFYNESASAIYDIPVICDNNVINEYSASGTGAFQLTMTNNYQYNSSNYPTKVTPGIASVLVAEEYFYK